MVQFTDVHYGENIFLDIQNRRIMEEILDDEKPDLVVITGDLVSGYAWDGKT
jgi:predicted MPP superfamily phosphohydrolase